MAYINVSHHGIVVRWQNGQPPRLPIRIEELTLMRPRLIGFSNPLK